MVSQKLPVPEGIKEPEGSGMGRQTLGLSVVRDYPGLYRVRTGWDKTLNPVVVVHLNRANEHESKILTEVNPTEVALWVNIASTGGEDTIEVSLGGFKTLKDAMYPDWVKSNPFLPVVNHHVRYAIISGRFSRQGVTVLTASPTLSEFLNFH